MPTLSSRGYPVGRWMAYWLRPQGRAGGIRQRQTEARSPLANAEALVLALSDIMQAVCRCLKDEQER